MNTIRGTRVMSLFGFGAPHDGTWTARDEDFIALGRASVGETVAVELRRVSNKVMDARIPVDPETGDKIQLLPVTPELIEQLARFLASAYWRGTLKAKGFDDSFANSTTAAMIKAAAEASHEEWKDAADYFLNKLAPSIR